MHYDAATRVFSGTPTADSPKKFTLRMSVNDGTEKGTAWFTQAFEIPNSAPTVGAGFLNQVIQVGETRNIPISKDAFNDLDQDTLTYALRVRSGDSLRSRSGSGLRQII